MRSHPVSNSRHSPCELSGLTAKFFAKMADPMRKDEMPQKAATRVLRDLMPRKDPKGGIFSFSKESPLPIPPPGFISEPSNGQVQRDG